MTHRQFLAWQVWQGEEWNRPDRTDHYLMNLARLQVDSKKNLGEFRLPFARVSDGQPPELSEVQQRRLSIEAKAKSLDRSGLLTPELLAKYDAQLKELNERG